MFGLSKKAPSLARLDHGTPRDDAIATARAALADAARYFTQGLVEIGIDCVHLAEPGESPVLPVSAAMENALVFDQGGERCALLLGKTGDFETFDLEPHYRFREIHLLLEELEAIAPGRTEARQRLIRQHASHALLQAGLLRYFLLRVATVERLEKAGDMKEIEREMAMLVQAIGGLTAGLPAPFARGLDLPAIRQEWNAWPHIMVEPVRNRG
jgi:hypothetical protein